MHELLSPASARTRQLLEAIPVGRRVNSARNQGRELVEAVGPALASEKANRTYERPPREGDETGVRLELRLRAASDGSLKSRKPRAAMTPPARTADTFT